MPWDKATDEWISPEQQAERRERRARISQLVSVCTASDLRARIRAQKIVVEKLLAEVRAAETRAEADRARSHAAVDEITRIAKPHGWLRIYGLQPPGVLVDYEWLEDTLPKKIPFEPYIKPARRALNMACLRASVEKAISRPSLWSILFRWRTRLRNFRDEFPALERAFNNLRHESIAEIRARGVAANATRHELMEALEKRLKLDQDAEGKRRSEERRRYEKARLAAIDEKTRQGVAAYRDLVEFNGFCAYCGTKIARGVNAHLDHIIPVAKSGMNSVENFAWTCDRCNLLKSDRSLYSFCKAAQLDLETVVARLHAQGKFV